MSSRHLRVLAVISVTGLLVLSSGGLAPGGTAAAASKTPITASRIYTGADHLTHVETITLDPKTGALAGLEQTELINPAGLQFARRAPGLVQDWHTAAQPQYAVTLSGRGEIEVSGDVKIHADPSHVLFFEDTTGKGHITRTLGNKDWTLMIVLLPKR